MARKNYYGLCGSCRRKIRPLIFVEEMIGGRAEKTLVSTINAADPALGLVESGGMTWEDADWD